MAKRTFSRDELISAKWLDKTARVAVLLASQLVEMKVSHPRYWLEISNTPW